MVIVCKKKNVFFFVNQCRIWNKIFFYPFKCSGLGILLQFFFLEKPTLPLWFLFFSYHIANLMLILILIKSRNFTVVIYIPLYIGLSCVCLCMCPTLIINHLMIGFGWLEWLYTRKKYFSSFLWIHVQNKDDLSISFFPPVFLMISYYIDMIWHPSMMDTPVYLSVYLCVGMCLLCSLWK